LDVLVGLALARVLEMRFILVRSADRADELISMALKKSI